MNPKNGKRQIATRNHPIPTHRRILSNHSTTTLTHRLHSKHNTLPIYDLTFNPNWATPYWATIRLSLAIIGITMILIPTLGYVSLSNMAVQADKATVYVCKSCQTSWSKVNKISTVNGKLPPLTIIKACASCDEKLLDWTMNKHTAQTPTSKQKPTRIPIQIESENQQHQKTEPTQTS